MRCLLLLLPVLQLFLCQSNPQTTPLSQGTTSEQSYNPSSGGLKVPWKIPPHMVVKAHEMKDFIAVSSHGRDDSDVSSSEKQPSLLALIMRSIYLFFLFLPAILTSGMAYVSQAFRNTVWFGLVTHSMAGGGAAFIKWGQWASTRPDMLPEELCAALSTLHSNAPTHSYAFTQRQIQTEFGSSIEEVFDFFSSTPVASGSIAQVYLARLHGRKVAVKVRHPNVEEQINIDFRIMKGLAAYLESFSALSWINLSESLNQFSHTIASQTDLSVEGKHLYLFNENFKQWKTVSFPVPILLSNSVLVESWEEGTTIAEYTELFGSASAASASDAPRGVRIMPELAFFVVSSGVNIYLKMLLTDNLMHSDLHPGAHLYLSSNSSLF